MKVKTVLIKTVFPMLVIGFLLMPMMIHAETTPDAQKWIDSLAGFYDKAPFQVELGGTMGGPGMPMSGSIEGVILVKDRTHQRARISFTMGNPEQGQGMKMDMLTVSDGTTSWTEMATPMGKQVMKMTLEEAKKMAEAGGAMPGMGSMDPFSLTDQLAATMDFKVASKEGGKVTLAGTFKDPSTNMMGGASIDGISLVLDEKTGFLDQIVVGGEQPILTMSVKNLSFLKASELEAGSFDYTPPEGVRVIDAAQLKAMQGQQGGGQQK